MTERGAVADRATAGAPVRVAGRALAGDRAPDRATRFVRARTKGRRTVRCARAAALLLLAATACDPPARFPDAGGRRPFGVQMHLHGSLSEGRGSMRGHLEEARRLGTVDALWWSDHDWRIALHTYQRSFDFESGALDTVVLVPRRRPGPLASGSDREGAGGGDDEGRSQPGESLDREGGASAAAGGTVREARASAPAEGDTTGQDADTEAGGPERCRVRWVARAGRPRDGGTLDVASAPGGRAGRAGRWSAAAGDSVFRPSSWGFVADKGRARFPLASRITLSLDAFPESLDAGDGRFVVSCFLSQQPPERRLGVLNFVAGNLAERAGRWGSDSLHVVEIPIDLAAGAWTHLALDVTRLAAEKGLGGADNSLTGVEIGLETRGGRRATVFVDDFAISEEIRGDSLLAWEEGFAAQPAARGDSIAQFVGLEISYSAHVNYFGPTPALPDFGSFPGGLTAEEAVRFAHDHGGLASLNHVFGTAFGETALRGKAEARVAEILGELRGTRCYGADLLEIGYPARVLSIENFLALWDSLWADGILVPGTGVSDSHENDRGWRDGDNFITWIWARSLARDDLLEGLRSGALAFGNPVLSAGRAILVTDDGHTMGQVIEGPSARHRFTFAIEGASSDWAAVPVVGGVRGSPVPLVGEGAVREVVFEAATPPGTWVRVEVRDARGAIVLCTNPIAFVKRAPDDVASTRRTHCGG